MNKRTDIRNIAIIAHVDHGKTTLVDSLLKQTGVFRKNQVVQDRVMDSNEIERERGITILSKNTAVKFGDTKINIIDTPGHADFGGEVERVLKMVNGVVLLVDAFEGPMPQTKFVLKKAVELDLPAVVCINKIDRKDARIEDVINEVIDLFIDLGADESYIESPFIYTSAKQGIAGIDYNDMSDDMKPLLNAIVDHIPCPEGDSEQPLQILVSTIDYNEYIGRIAIGRVSSGKVNLNDEVVLVNAMDNNKKKKAKISNLFLFEGLERIPVESAQVGDIVAISGIEDISIGDTVCPVEYPNPLEFVKISEPTIAMTFMVNNSPFAGKEGDFVTSRQIRNRLFRELQTDVSLRVEETDSTDAFKVSGRGELHLSVLIENMSREGYEFQISKPVVLYKENGKGDIEEPMEEVTIYVEAEYIGAVIDKLGKRKGELKGITESQNGYSKAVFSIPARGLIGYRQEFMTDTRGRGILNTQFVGYSPYKGDIPRRNTGSLIASETGLSTAYGLNAAKERGILFIAPGVEVYEGMIVGENPKGLDIEVNVVRKKQQSNIRAAGSDEAIKLPPAKELTLEQALEFIEDDELIEITPKSLRLRKKILNKSLRYKSKK